MDLEKLQMRAALYEVLRNRRRRLGGPSIGPISPEDGAEVTHQSEKAAVQADEIPVTERGKIHVLT